jgi:hypothetical protein
MGFMVLSLVIAAFAGDRRDDDDDERAGQGDLPPIRRVDSTS